MDGGSFYGVSQQSSSRARGRDSVALPRDSHGHDASPGPVVRDVGISQKLDWLISLMEEQRSEATKMKADMAELQDDILTFHAKETKQTQATAVKLPLELSVSSHVLFAVFIIDTLTEASSKCLRDSCITVVVLFQAAIKLIQERSDDDKKFVGHEA